MSPPAGGSIIGANHPQGGFVNGQVEAAWIATFVLYIIYLLFLFLDPLFERYTRKLSKEPEREPVMVATGSQGVSVVPSPPPNVRPTISPEELSEREHKRRRYTRLMNVGNAARDAFLILFGSALITMAGFGFTYGPMVIQWLLMSLLVLWVIFQVIPRTAGWALDFLLVFGIAVLAIIIWGMAFRSYGSSSVAGV